MNLKNIKTCLSQEKENLAKYNIKSLGIFGSYVRGEQRHDSDINILVEFNSNDDMDLLSFIELKNYLSKCLGRKVDLVMKDTLKPHIEKYILNEVIYYE